MSTVLTCTRDINHLTATDSLHLLKHIHQYQATPPGISTRAQPRCTAMIISLLSPLTRNLYPYLVSGEPNGINSSLRWVDPSPFATELRIKNVPVTFHKRNFDSAGTGTHAYHDQEQRIYSPRNTDSKKGILILINQ